jgi:hypothetical protein
MGAVQNLVDQTRQWWAEKPARDAEWKLWANVPDLAHLRELVAWFCEGKLSFTPGHAGPRCEETEGAVGAALAHANRSGFLTTNSQNGGENEYSGQWRSCVEGLADDATVARLRGLVAGTRLCLQAAPLKFFTQTGTVPGVHQKPDGGAYDGNDVPPWRVVAFWFKGIPDEVLSQVTRLNYVQIVDPKWGPTSLLWERLSAPDWDNPPPPNASLWNQWYERTPPTDEQVEHLSQAVEQAFAERDRLVDVWRKTGRDEDESAADAQDATADGLLIQYNAACQAQYAESDRRRAENLARYAEMQVAREMERDGGGTFVDMPPPAEPYQPRVEVCGICDQPGSAHPKADHSPEGYDPEDGHHYCPKGRRCPTCQTRPEPPKSSTTRPPRHAAAPTSSSGATMTSADTYSGLRARIMGVASRTPERQGPLQQALQGVEEDIAELNSISENSSQAGIQEALGSLMRAKESIEEANWMVGAAQASTEGAAAGLQ